MSIIYTVHEKLSISGWQEYKARRYGIKSCKPKMDSFFISDIKDIYMFFKEKEECEEALSCYCSIEKIEETINTL